MTIASPELHVSAVGREREPLVMIDGFATDPDALRAAAAAAYFTPADEYYPGIRAPLPPNYLAEQLPLIGRLVARYFGRCRRVRVVDASFSIVTTHPEDLNVGQRVPHVDAYGRERIALVHYLSPTDDAGTAFFRHRATGFETVDATRANEYSGQLDRELRTGGVPAAYIYSDTALFECTALASAAYNRALLYRSYMLHSGAIPASATLMSDPTRGRLTVTGFFAIE